MNEGRIQTQISKNSQLMRSVGESPRERNPGWLQELWFHTGTDCNLQCPMCFERAAPGDQRLETVTFEDVRPFIDQAVEMGVERFSFTGGEPFVAPDMIRILDYALNFRPCLVQTNGLLQPEIDQAFALIEKDHPLSFQISLDYPHSERHNAKRGAGAFETALETLSELYSAGFNVSVARLREDGEHSSRVDAAYRPFFESVDLAPETPIISFPDFCINDLSEMTPADMDSEGSDDSQVRLMCEFSRMVVKQDGKMNIFACALVNDDPRHNLGHSLESASTDRGVRAHPRCALCYSGEIPTASW